VKGVTGHDLKTSKDICDRVFAEDTEKKLESKDSWKRSWHVSHEVEEEIINLINIGEKLRAIKHLYESGKGEFGGHHMTLKECKDMVDDLAIKLKTRKD
jgi:hypothetical protein